MAPFREPKTLWMIIPQGFFMHAAVLLNLAQPGEDQTDLRIRIILGTGDRRENAERQDHRKDKQNAEYRFAVHKVFFLLLPAG